MTFVTLIHDPQVSIASDKLVIPAAELKLTQDAVHLGSNLACLLNEEQNRIETAEQEGYESGYQRGKEDGLRNALDDLSAGLKDLAVSLEQRDAELQRSVARVAIQVVRKIASEVGSREMVASLAKTAARELVAVERLVVAVHPDMLEAVVERLRAPVDESWNKHLEVQADESLALFDCVLHTETGSVVAGLDAQLANLEKALAKEGGKTAVERTP